MPGPPLQGAPATVSTNRPASCWRGWPAPSRPGLPGGPTRSHAALFSLSSPCSEVLQSEG
eukprot:12417379-Alexandrium_andersonii.AAC.1